MNLSLQRTHQLGAATFGELRLADQRICYTLEDEVREIEGEPVASWKIKGATAIPSGRYRITLEHSPRFGPDTLTVNNVPGFTGVRMHAGNTADDTEGCPLLGLAIDARGIVGGTSRPAVDRVRDLVRGAIGRGVEVWMDVCNVEGLA